MQFMEDYLPISRPINQIG